MIEFAIPQEIAWAESLRPIRPPSLEPLQRGMAVRVWHVDIELMPISLRERDRLTKYDTWNWKALVVSENPLAGRSVGEVEVTERLRGSGMRAYWTGGQGLWHRWTLRSNSVEQDWFRGLDQQVRRLMPDRRSTGGCPDVIARRPDTQVLHCVEYKGPSPTTPARRDEIRDIQRDWYIAALDAGVITPDRYIVARWIPTPEATRLLLMQAAAFDKLAQR